MRQTILLLTIFFSLTCFAQERRKWKGSFLLAGQVESLTSGVAILTYNDVSRKGNEIKVLKASIANGKFGFSDFIEEPVYATLSIGDNQYNFYIDPTTVSLIVKNDNSIEVTGSWTNDDKIKIEQLEERISQMAGDGTKNGQGNLAELSYASVTRDSFVVLCKMLEVANPEHPYYSDSRSKQMIGILMNMSDDLKNTPTGVRASEALFISSVKMFSK